MKQLFRSIIIMMMVTLVTAGCARTMASDAANTPTGTAVPPTATATSTPRPTASITATSQPTAKPTPSPTTSATQIPAATPTSTPLPEPTATDVPVATAQALAALGLQIYSEQYCGICHQLDAAGTKGIFGPSHNGLGQTAARRIQDSTYHGTAHTPAEYIRESILDPEAYIVPGFEQSRHKMPAFTHLTDAQVEALVQMLLQQ